MQDASKTRENEQTKMVSEIKFFKEEIKIIKDKLSKILTLKYFSGISCCFTE